MRYLYSLAIVAAVVVLLMGTYFLYGKNGEETNKGLATSEYTFKDGKMVMFNIVSYEGSVTSPIKIVGGTKGPWPKDYELSYRLLSPDGKELLDGSIPTSESDAQPDKETFSVQSATFKNTIGGKGSVLLEKNVTVDGIEDKDIIVIPVEF